MDEIIDDISDKIFLDKLKTEFERSVKESVSGLQKTGETGSYKDIRRIAHDIKGIAGVFGFDKGAEIASELLRSIDSNDKKDIFRLKEELIDYLSRNVIDIRTEDG